jgi:hypothetical protein
MPASATPSELVIIARFVFGRRYVADRFELAQARISIVISERGDPQYDS